MARLLLLAAELCLLSFSAAGRVCGRPREVDSAIFRPGRVVYNALDIVTYSCVPGFVKASGNDKAVCQTLGNWEHATLRCTRRQCPVPAAPENGSVYYKEITYQSVASFSCDEGHRLLGSNETECLVSGGWSAPPPACEKVTCPYPEIPRLGRLEFYEPRRGNVSTFRDVVRYGCDPHYALIGNETAMCRANATWSHVPECREVTCQRPAEIPNGFTSFAPYRRYHYREAVTYGCNPPYTLEGPRASYCDKDGEWTPKPLCQAPCHVPTPKANVLHNGRKTRVDEISRQQIQHGDVITYYCKNKTENCAYSVPSRCHDANFTVPACYKKPGLISVFSTDPSKMTPCPHERKQR
ncbi:beta-2-glycoprotein 1-like isoform 2-T2 [Anomaloglossus baeobatrachus]|uniref:beta-2-glycoprotein 1-like isoform X2 n=1 Tax=Anomaloglossus baeobatrachus TaxID=238106 RepID=UPI003F4FE9F6